MLQKKEREKWRKKNGANFFAPGKMFQIAGGQVQAGRLPGIPFLPVNNGSAGSTYLCFADVQGK